MAIEDVSGCIYCGEVRPFSDEHVFCAGLGGDDKTCMLRKLVCSVCNAEIFSPLEAAFMRSSPESFARVFLQPRGRDRKKKSKGPTFQPESVRTYLDDSGAVEAELRQGGQLVLLPQFKLFEGHLRGQGSQQVELRLFVAELTELLALETLPVVTKSGAPGRTQYMTTRYHWTGTQYVLGGRATSLKPPQRCIWRDLKGEPGHTDPAPTIFQRSGGQVVLRSSSDVASNFLAILRAHMAELATAAETARIETEVQGAPVNVQLKVDIEARERVFAKLGVNMAAFVLGEGVVRHPSFGPIKTSILTGESPIRTSQFSLEDLAPENFLHKLFGAVPEKHHICLLTTVNKPSGDIDLLYMIRLYSGVVKVVELAQNLPIHINLPVFMLVDYVNHRIKLVNTFEFLNDLACPSLAPTFLNAMP
jgi:hypothetical protein